MEKLKMEPQLESMIKLQMDLKFLQLNQHVFFLKEIGYLSLTKTAPYFNSNGNPAWLQ